MKVQSAEELNKKFLRDGMWPTIFCNGCGHGVVLEYTLWALEELGWDMDSVVFASGIGCSSRLPGYIKADGLHTTHGRALAFATGIKAANPDLKVIVFTGDGDCAGIGGNHFIHAARRNIDITVLMLNNFIYGMTGGQLAPTAPLGSIATTAPYGNIEPSFDICNLAKALGANYVARWTVSHPYQPIKSVKAALEKTGFSLVEFLSPCPTAYGRRNKLGDIKQLWEWYDNNTILIEDYERIMTYGSEEEKNQIRHMFPIGVFQDIDKPGFFEAYEKLVNRLMEKDSYEASKVRQKVVVQK
ncbi:MAG: 2-oxoacid:ferredoxin oxidoreductase subunit beta [Candidatus Thermoplasmatota archaeon]|nr:2-oxoacid:ferredoxin oxidoreductase subunit beta [Candidatus Thermoplasmatota archaeon]